MTNDVPRGIRNNNPGNIRRSARGPVWKNEVWPGEDDAFCTFPAPEWGIRAMVITLTTYQQKDGCETVAQVIRRWAPPSENDTSKYVAFVGGRMATPIFTRFNPADWPMMRDLVAAIIAEECEDYAYPSATMVKGLMSAGLMPTPPSEQPAPAIVPAAPVALPPPDAVTADMLNDAELQAIEADPEADI